MDRLSIVTLMALGETFDVSGDTENRTYSVKKTLQNQADHPAERPKMNLQAPRNTAVSALSISGQSYLALERPLAYRSI